MINVMEMIEKMAVYSKLPLNKVKNHLHSERTLALLFLFYLFIGRMFSVQSVLSMAIFIQRHMTYCI